MTICYFFADLRKRNIESLLTEGETCKMFDTQYGTTKRIEDDQRNFNVDFGESQTLFDASTPIPGRIPRICW